MSYAFKINFRNLNSIEFQVNYLNTTDTHLTLYKHLDGSNPIFIETRHSLLNTNLDLCQIPTFVLLYFNNKSLFLGASLTSGKFDGDFSIVTQSSKMVFIPSKIEFDLGQVVSFDIID